MADVADDLGLPVKPVRPVLPPIMPPRMTDVARDGNEAIPLAATPAIARSDQVERRTMIVGPEISLSGDINACNRLIVEGTVEVRLHDCRELDISATGLFKGSASIESAEISGRFEGDLVVRKRLLIRASGHVSGTVTYGQIEIERGGKLSGTLQVQEVPGASPFLEEPAFARSRATASR